MPFITRPIVDLEKDGISRQQIEDDTSTSATSTVSRDEEDEGAVDMGLALTCSFRSGIGPRQLQLEHPPDGGTQAWLQGIPIMETLAMHVG